jgi:hypothetical protein
VAAARKPLTARSRPTGIDCALRAPSRRRRLPKSSPWSNTTRWVRPSMPLAFEQSGHSRPHRNGNSATHSCTARRTRRAPTCGAARRARGSRDCRRRARSLPSGASSRRWSSRRPAGKQQRFEEGALGDDVQAQGRFVEDQQVRALRQRQREVDAGAFAARQLGDLLLGLHVEVAHAPGDSALRSSVGTGGAASRPVRRCASRPAGCVLR